MLVGVANQHLKGFSVGLNAKRREVHLALDSVHAAARVLVFGHGFALSQNLVHLLNHIGTVFAQVHVDGHHVIDGQHLQTTTPSLRGIVRIREHRLQTWIVWQVAADDGRIEFARQQHVDHLAALWRTLKTLGIRKLSQVTMLKRHPLHFGQVDPIVVGQHTAHPRNSGLGMRTNAHAFAIELGHRYFAALSVVHQAVVLETAFAHHRRQQCQGFAVGFGLQVRDQGQLGHIKRQFSYHALERTVGRFDGVKFKIKQLGTQHAVFQSHGVGVIAQQGFEFEFFGFQVGGHAAQPLFRSGYNACAVPE